MALVDRHINDFLQEVKKLDPDLRCQINSDQGLFYIQLHSLADWTQKAIDGGREEDFQRVFEIVERYFSLVYMDRRFEEFNNAIYVAYLEHLDFSGELRAHAWDRFPDVLQQGFRDIMRYWEKVSSRKLQWADIESSK